MPLFRIDRHQHAFVGVAEFVGQRVARDALDGFGSVSGTQRPHPHRQRVLPQQRHAENKGRTKVSGTEGEQRSRRENKGVRNRFWPNHQGNS